MSEFVLNRNHTLSDFGHRVEFKKGVPTWVPPLLEKQAAAIGAERVDGTDVDPLPDDAPQVKVLDAVERLNELVSAIEIIVERNSSDDFGGDNRPSVAALNKLVELTNPALSKKERDLAWNAYREKKAAE